MSLYGGSNFSTVQLQIQNALSRPLLYRIQDIEDIINTTSTKELRNALPLIVESVFGYGQESGWDIDRISKKYYSEFESIRHFLSPQGPLMKLVYHLQNEPYTYHFSLQHLPNPSRHMIEDGLIPTFYANKIQQQSHGLILTLGAFEFYMFHFAYALVNPKHKKSTWHDFYEYIYPNLMNDYMEYFLPLDKKRLPVMPHTASPIRTTVSHYSLSPGHSPNPSPNISPFKTPRGLFKTSFTVANQKQHIPSSPVLDQNESETWRSETMLQIWSEFWLNQNATSNEPSGLPQASVISSYAPHTSHNTSYDSRDPFHILYEHYLPSSNHVSVVRVLVRYLHYFINTASPGIVTSTYQPTQLSMLDEFKKSVVPQIIQKKLYTFLKHAFDHWPLDSSFKMLIEIWLCYIQPWRYSDPKYFYQKEMAAHVGDRDYDKKLEDKWYQFIEDNLLFYTVLFQDFLPRVYRLDLTCLNNSYMIYRVTKVFNKTNLCHLIERAERKTCSSSFITSRSGNHINDSYHGMSDSFCSLPPQYADLESPGFTYTPLFGSRTFNLAQAVLDQMIDAKIIGAKPPVNVTKQKKKGWLRWFVDGLFGEDSQFGEISPEEMKKQQNYLTYAVKYFSMIFKFQIPVEIENMSLPADTTLNESAESTLPDFIQTENGPQLTDLGRYQVANGLKKFDVVYYGDPDLEPIRSYENATLVRYLHQFCDKINTKYAKQILVLNHRTDFIAKMIQTFISPPISPHEQIMSPMSKVKAEHLRQPRLSLRFLASYQNLIYFGLLYLVLNLWLGFGPAGFLIVLFFGAVFYAAFSALVRPTKHNSL
ncbi:hypothetical protein LOTGIDRAFT_232075 [Lottia gigantea]|uniref:Sphingomyelin phosphodiesterase 4 n=1 Tax=Lottia gigantea TaxID=225164 RepID=V4C1S0_LOTGI|nr:hypothetical protein LOTGIDRAFT_232075 [Lottia gigantea]ESO95394.1 hypothetical protein LOTGIDRAFT_232075 [Lottia gigantea]